MKVSEFDYYLPPELIAQEPVEPRDSSRLLVLHREDGRIEHRIFREVIDYLVPGDGLVLNETRVIRARLPGRKEGSGGKVEVLLLSPIGENTWEVLVRPGKRAHPGTSLIFGDGLLRGDVQERTPEGGRIIRFEPLKAMPVGEALEAIGKVPLPPYIKRELRDDERYQTVYARQEGSCAAPTAGLHFTESLLERIRQKGIEIVKILLHVGMGTFRPVKVEEVTEHKMHREYYEVSEEAAARLNSIRASGGRIVVVGTTSVRALESSVDEMGRFLPKLGYTDIFIYPGYKFRAVDALITNFHLPKSTLIMLVSAFAGKETILNAYRVAVEEGYRFYSFGDAMLIL